jgi:transposase
MKYIGVDLHTTQLTICYRDEAGNEELETVKIAQIERFLAKLKSEDKVAFEATGNSLYLQDVLLQMAVPKKNIYVVNTLRFKLISQSVKKTDKNDARMLAEYLSKDMLPIARLRSETDSQIINLIETRDMLVTSNTAFKNQIHNIFVKLGIKLIRKDIRSERGRKNLADKLELTGVYRFQVELALRNIEHNCTEIRTIEAKLNELKSEIKQMKNLESISGIGMISAMTIKAVIGDINDFESPNKLVSYAGLCPWVSNSNETVCYGGITKHGNRLLRKLLVQCAWVSIRFNPELKEFYNKLKKKKPAGKAIVAVARKLVHQIYYTLKYDWHFTDKTNTVKEIRVCT